MKLKLAAAFFFGAVAGITAGCQTYDFEPVTPLAIAQTTQSRNVAGRQLKPQLMLLIDKSGSMEFPANTTGAGCTMPCVSSAQVSATNCSTACPARMRELKTAMQTFLTASSTVAWMGMAIYPTTNVVPPAMSADACGATGNTDILAQLPSGADPTDPDASLSSAATAVNTRVQALLAGGGTPTGASLRFLGDYAPLNNPDRDDFVLLLTDGLPNCNGANANTCDNANLALCRCTLATCSVANGFCARGCLDADNSAAQITELRKKNIRTIVVGFGADTAVGDGPAALNQMAEAGGFPRPCRTGMDSECGTGNSCVVANPVSNSLCVKKYYQASSANDLAIELDRISKELVNADPCSYKLDALPSDPNFLSVLIDGASKAGCDMAPGCQTWTYAAGKVTFQGDLCTKVQMADTLHPVKVEFRIVESL